MASAYSQIICCARKGIFQTRFVAMIRTPELAISGNRQRKRNTHRIKKQASPTGRGLVDEADLPIT